LPIRAQRTLDVHTQAVINSSQFPLRRAFPFAIKYGCAHELENPAIDCSWQLFLGFVEELTPSILYSSTLDSLEAVRACPQTIFQDAVEITSSLWRRPRREKSGRENPFHCPFQRADLTRIS